MKIVDVQDTSLSHKELLLGNEALAIGALEASISYAGAYPGTPSTEITEYLHRNSSKTGVKVEWCMNEKIAFEKALGVSLCNKRALVCMKHAGVNWIADTLSVAVLGGIRGGLVIVSADDPNCHSSANEQDNRFYADFFKIPVLEPCNPVDARAIMLCAFNLSERIQLPVMLRTVTRVSHTRADVAYGSFPEIEKKGSFDTSEERFYLSTFRSLKRHKWLLDQQSEIQKVVESYDLNQLEKSSPDIVIVASGIGYEYVKEVLNTASDTELIGLVKISCSNYLPNNIIESLVQKCKQILVVEEGGPLVEEKIKVMSDQVKGSANILGKSSGHMECFGELTIEKVANFIRLNAKDYIDIPQPPGKSFDVKAPQRLPSFCAGCPHSNVFYSLKKVKRKIEKAGDDSIVVVGDIGCYSIGKSPPYSLGDIKYSMGSSIGVAQGIKEGSINKVVALVGDGTFFHASLTSIANSIKNDSNILVIILDNDVIAMTGMQPTPADQEAQVKPLSIENILQGMGCDSFVIVDSFDILNLQNSIYKSLFKNGLSVIIARGPCAVVRKRHKTRTKNKTYSVLDDLCQKCMICVNAYSCPAIYVTEDKHVKIDKNLCIGCSSCEQICPENAIVPDTD